MSETRTVRLPVDLVEMMSAISRQDGKTAAEIIEPLVRNKVEKLFGQLPDIAQRYTRDRIARLTGEPTPTTAAK